MNNKVIALGTFLVSVSTVTGYALYSKLKKAKEEDTTEEVIEEEESE